MRRSWRGRTVAMLAGLVTAALACGGRSGGSGNLSVSARSGASARVMGGSLDLGNGIQVDRIRIAVVKVALESGSDAGDASDGAGGTAGVRAADQGSGGGSGSGGDGQPDGESDEVKVGPCLVELSGGDLGAGSSAVSPVCAADIPAGTYQELEVDVGPVAASAAGGVAGLAALDGASIVVDGTFDGAGFSFRSAIDVRQKTETPISVDASSNVTITIDPSGWFTAGGGGALDPALVANQQAIDDNIRASIRAFQDDNRDGQEDGGEGR